MTTVKEMNTQTAEKMLAAAIDKSKVNGARMNIAIVDAGANLKAFHRDDHAVALAAVESVSTVCVLTRRNEFLFGMMPYV
jgi:uncharacterized protein GlcG (DUF336 family)